MEKQLFALLREIASITTKAGREAFATQHRDNPDLTKLLAFLLDENVVTGISTKTVSSFRGTFSDYNGYLIPDFFGVLDFLKTNNTGSKEVVEKAFASLDKMGLDPEDLDTAYALVSKNFKCGLTAKTLNDLWGYLVVLDFACQLAKPLEDPSKLRTRVSVSLKLDGHRMPVFIEPTGITFYTRKGKKIEGLHELAGAIRASFDLDKLLEIYPDGFVLDGEGIVYSEKGDYKERYNETSSILRSNGEKFGIEFDVFDGLPLDEFLARQSKNSYFERRAILESFYRKADKLVTLLEPLYQTEGIPTQEDIDYMYQLLDEVVAQGSEGLMINQDTPYKATRHDGLLKMKPSYTADLEIIGFEEGDAMKKYAGLLGRLIVDFKGNPVGVGSGLTDELRKEIWENQDKYLGMIVEVAYSDISTNKNDDQLSLRHPRFKRFRPDKTVEDISYA